MFDNIEIYSSKFTEYGKTTEIIYKVKSEKGDYKYLPIGATINRDYVINNLINLELNLKQGKTTYLHLDLSETNNNEYTTNPNVISKVRVNIIKNFIELTKVFTKSPFDTVSENDHVIWNGYQFNTNISKETSEFFYYFLFMKNNNFF